jgi:hypothetical protein
VIKGPASTELVQGLPLSHQYQLPGIVFVCLWRERLSHCIGCSGCMFTARVGLRLASCCTAALLSCVMVVVLHAARGTASTSSWMACMRNLHTLQSLCRSIRRPCILCRSRLFDP